MPGSTARILPPWLAVIAVGLVLVGGAGGVTLLGKSAQTTAADLATQVTEACRLGAVIGPDGRNLCETAETVRQESPLTPSDPPADGQDGRDGMDGTNGTPGETGQEGQAGTPGTNGVDGKPGETGQEGQAGTPGTNGVDGQPGTPGADGQAGTPGTNGVDGQPGAPGRGISSTEPDGCYRVVRYSDGTSERWGPFCTAPADSDPDGSGPTATPEPLGMPLLPGL